MDKYGHQDRMKARPTGPRHYPYVTARYRLSPVRRCSSTPTGNTDNNNDRCKQIRSPLIYTEFCLKAFIDNLFSDRQGIRKQFDLICDCPLPRSSRKQLIRHPWPRLQSPRLKASDLRSVHLKASTACLVRWIRGNRMVRRRA